MKKILILLLFLTFFQFSKRKFVSANTLLDDTSYSYSKEEKLGDIIILLLDPYIKDELEKYYSKYLTSIPIAYPYQTKVLNVEGIKGSYPLTLKLELSSVIGPHISVGKDHITFEISPFKTKVKSFEHIKSYKLPKHLENNIIKGYNNPIP